MSTIINSTANISIATDNISTVFYNWYMPPKPWLLLLTLPVLLLILLHCLWLLSLPLLGKEEVVAMLMVPIFLGSTLSGKWTGDEEVGWSEFTLHSELLKKITDLTMRASLALASVTAHNCQGSSYSHSYSSDSMLVRHISTKQKSFLLNFKPLGLTECHISL